MHPQVPQPSAVHCGQGRRGFQPAELGITGGLVYSAGPRTPESMPTFILSRFGGPWGTFLVWLLAGGKSIQTPFQPEREAGAEGLPSGGWGPICTRRGQVWSLPTSRLLLQGFWVSQAATTLGKNTALKRDRVRPGEHVLHTQTGPRRGGPNRSPERRRQEGQWPCGDIQQLSTGCGKLGQLGHCGQATDLCIPGGCVPGSRKMGSASQKRGCWLSKMELFLCICLPRAATEERARGHRSLSPGKGRKIKARQPRQRPENRTPPSGYGFP